jgi:putative transposase
MDDKQREEVALFRYGVIAELVQSPLAPGDKERILMRQAAREWQIPGTDRHRIGRSTIRDWAEIYQAQGLEGLKPRPRSDSGSSRAIPESVLELLLALRRERPRASVQSLIRAVYLSGQLPSGLRLRRSTVYRLLAAHGMATATTPEATPNAQAFTHPHANDLWTSDIMHGPRLLVPGRREGTKTYLYALLDDASRVVPFAAFYGAENAACFQDALKQGLLRRGMPRKLYCDNGATFRTHHLQVICATLNIALIHSRPHQPRGRGKVERFFRHVRSAFLPHLVPPMLASLAALNRVFWAWLEAEYHQTPHGGLGGATPLDRYLDDQGLIRPAPAELDDLMRMRVTRRVGRDRTVRLDGRLYEAPDGFAGETVTVLFDPYDPGRPVHLVRSGEPGEVALRPLDLHLNASLRRGKPEAAPQAEPAPTGISYLDLVAQGFYSEGK